ncbi:MAG TPA: hypothetical protein VM925_05255 [Labilithrix sp.]|nr:hypothetical protein [Labilithrix sp.]
MLGVLGVSGASGVLGASNMESVPKSASPNCAACAVCGTTDARLLVMVELRGGAAVTLCGSHALMHSRTNAQCRTVSELRAALAERRSTDRRAQGEGDELAERLAAAFTRERRSTDRRAEGAASAEPGTTDGR